MPTRTREAAFAAKPDLRLLTLELPDRSAPAMTSSGWPGLPRPGPRHRQTPCPPSSMSPGGRPPTQAGRPALRLERRQARGDRARRGGATVGIGMGQTSRSMPSSSRSAGLGACRQPAVRRGIRRVLRARPARRHRGRRHRGHPARRQRARRGHRGRRPARSPCSATGILLSPLRPDMRRPLAALALITLAAAPGPRPTATPTLAER